MDLKDHIIAYNKLDIWAVWRLLSLPPQLQQHGGGGVLVPVLVLQVALVNPNILSVLSPTLVKGKGVCWGLVKNLGILRGT